MAAMAPADSPLDEICLVVDAASVRGDPLLVTGDPNHTPLGFVPIGDVGGLVEGDIGLEKLTDRWLSSLSNSCSCGKLEILCAPVPTKLLLSTLEYREPFAGVGEVTRIGGSRLAERL